MFLMNTIQRLSYSPLSTPQPIGTEIKISEQIIGFFRTGSS
jgi:hypothetical protein